jgi:hypothetical protein
MSSVSCAGKRSTRFAPETLSPEVLQGFRQAEHGRHHRFSHARGLCRPDCNLSRLMTMLCTFIQDVTGSTLGRLVDYSEGLSRVSA